jgi:MFS family permease
MGKVRSLSRVWPDEPGIREALHACHNDILQEFSPSPGVFTQELGPFTHYRREIISAAGGWRETISYRLDIPWFAWIFTVLVARHLRQRQPMRAPSHLLHLSSPLSATRRRSPWWAPPDLLTSAQVSLLCLLAAASMSAAYINTVFSQTVKFAADDFGVGSGGIGIAGSVVRAGIVISLPAAFLADRIGRRRVIIALAFAAPVATALGSVMPSFALLVASQTVGRPLGIALGFLVAVIAAEEMPRGTRAFAVSVLAMASGLGAGIAVIALPLADLGTAGWRIVFLVTLIWMPVAVDLARRLPETARFLAHADHRRSTGQQSGRLNRKRMLLLGTVAVAANLFVAPASFFQNAYLREVREYSATMIAIFTLATATPAAIGLILGGRIADLRGRRILIATALPISTVLLVLAFSIGGPVMWISTFGGGFMASLAYPALAVYRSELFPTAHRSRAAGLLTATALVGGIFGLLAAGAALEAAWGYGPVMAILALGQVIVVVTVLWTYPETARRSLEDLNPTDLPRPGL